VTVREMVRAAQFDLMRDNVTPADVRHHLMTLSALMGNVNTDYRHAEVAYNAVLLTHLEGAEKANRARIKAQATPEYVALLEARHVREEVDKTNQALKKCLDSLIEEQRGSRWQP
jgi:hypothetical protein